jgi:uncharacterized membrane protein YfcA
VFTAEALIAGVIAAYIIGFSKTALPGAALLAVPLFATVFDGRLIAGGTLPVLLFADVFAVSWYRRHTRWDVLRPLAVWIGLGYLFGIAFFVGVGSASRPVEVAIGAIVVFIVVLQVWRLWRSNPARPANTGTAAVYGTTGGFTTFVANAAGPVINTYLVGAGLPKAQMVGTSAWLYFIVNLSKIPLYLMIGAWTAGGQFFTADSLSYDALVLPGVVAGVFSGKLLFDHIPQRLFLALVLLLSGAGALRLLL